MDCNSYSYAPHMLDDYPHKRRPETVSAITIERKQHNGNTYYTIRDPEEQWFSIAHTLDAALKTIADYMTNGI